MILKKENLPWFTTAAVIIIFAVLMVLQKCSSDRNLADTLDQITRLKDTVIVYREVDGKEVGDSKAANLTINEYRAADPGNLAAIEAIIKRKDDLISTLVLEITNERRRREAEVSRDSAGNIIASFEDSCLTMKTTIPKTGKAIVDYQLKAQTYIQGTVMRREKWWKSKQPVATGSITSGCGKITNQKVVLISEGKPKVHQTLLFKSAVVIAIFESIRFAITGKL